MNTPQRWSIGLIATVGFYPASAQAQTAPGSFEELNKFVKADEIVVVTDTNGCRMKGTLVAVDRDSLSVTTHNRTQTFARFEISTVRLADGLGNGALIGAGAGLGTAVGILTIAGSGDGYILPSAKAGAPLLFAGIGALLGVLVDRAHEGGRVVYVAPGPTASRSVRADC